MNEIHYDINDPLKIQGRDEVGLDDHSLAALRLRKALDALGEGGRLRVLCPGAGAGRYARALARERPGWQVTAGDLSEVAVEEARRAGGGPEYLVFDAQEMPFNDDAFDALVFFDLLEHLPDPRRLMDECHRVLRPGGVLHFFVPLERQPGTLYRLLDEDRPVPIHRWKRDHVGHIQRFTESDVVAMVWNAGFEVRDLAHSFHLVGQLHDLVDYWQRERSRGGDGRIPRQAVNLIARLVHVATWRVSYLEDRAYSGPILASGLHVTARCYNRPTG